MVINLFKQKTSVNQPGLKNACYFNDLIGFWATVTKVYSELNCVDITSNFGDYKRIPVASSTWVNSKAGDINNVNGYISGEINLPPEKSFVFVLMPEKTPDSAFVLCSGFPLGSTATHAMFAQDKTEKTELDSARKIHSCSGWKFKENYRNGKIEIENQRKDIEISIDTENKNVKITAYKATVEITSEGIINLNGDNNGGLCKTPELKSQLEKMTVRIDGIINALKNSPTAAQDGGATYKSAITVALNALTNKEDFSEIESKKTKHGE